LKAMIVDWQNEPIKGALLHIDLKRIAMDKAIRVSVPIQLIGVPVGVRPRAASWSMCCARWRLSACPQTSQAIWTPMFPVLRSTRPYTSPTCRTWLDQFLDDESLTVAHVSLIKEEVVAVEEVAEAATEPEVAKKGKGETEAASDAKTDAKTEAKPDAKKK